MAKDRCQILSGSFTELVRAAESGVRAERAVFAIQSSDRPFLTDFERDSLWERFQVPVVGLLLDRRGRLVAWECEAQDGMHVGGAWSEEAIWVQRLLATAGALESSQCECGRPGQRLRATELRIPRRGPARATSTVPATIKELQRA